MLELVLKHDLHYSILVDISDPETNLVNNICLYRHGSNQPFEDADRLLVNELMPDIIESFVLYRRNQLNKTIFKRWREKYSLAYSNYDGVLRDAEPQCVKLLQKEWPNWCGPLLPADLIRFHEDTNSDLYRGTHIVVRCIEVQNFLIIICSDMGELSVLSKREQIVADKFVSGKTYKDVAQELHISPSTAKTHLRHIYRKLNINDKTKLEEIMGKVFKT